MLATVLWTASLTAAEPVGDDVPPAAPPPQATPAGLPPLATVKPALEAAVPPLAACLKRLSPTQTLKYGGFTTHFRVAGDGALMELVRVNLLALTPPEDACVADWLTNVRLPTLAAPTPAAYVIEFRICPPEVNDVWVTHVERSSQPVAPPPTESDAARAARLEAIERMRGR